MYMRNKRARSIRRVAIAAGLTDKYAYRKLKDAWTKNKSARKGRKVTLEK